LAYEDHYLTTLELVEALEGVIKQLEKLASQLEKLRDLWASGSQSEVRADINRYLMAQFGQLANVGLFLKDIAKRRIGALTPKASLLKRRLEYLETRSAIGMISEEVYISAIRELMGHVGEVEGSSKRLMELIDQLDKVMLKSEDLFRSY
jgi:hypothetical protein